MLFDNSGPWYPNTFRLPTWANTYAVGQHSYIFDVRLRICWTKVQCSAANFANAS